LAADAYSLAHFPLIAGVIYFALGIDQVLIVVSHGHTSTLDWTSATALYGGVVLYLLGRFAFLRLTVRTTSPGQVAAIGLLTLLVPAARSLPAAAALGLLAAVLVVLAGYEQMASREPA
jgi:low temperature requirement protein LtrA